MKLTHSSERMTPEFDKGELIYYEHIARYIFASQFIKNKSVLDVACGSGYGVKILLEHGAKNVIGVDNSKETIFHAKKYYGLKNATFVLADALKLPFKNNEFDVVTSFETIEHLKNRDLFIREVKRVLKERGLFILSTPNILVYPKGNPFHIKEFNPAELQSFLKKYFKNIKILFQNNSFATSILSSSSLKNNLEMNLKNFKDFKLSPNQGLYLVTIASDASIPKTLEESFLYNPGLPEKVSEKMGLLSRSLRETKDQLKEIRASRGFKIISKIHKTRIRIPVLKNV